MKINNARIFTADIYMVTNSTVTDELKQSLNHGTVFGSYSYDDLSYIKGAVVVYFKEKNAYVPVGHLRNMISYLNVKLDSTSNDKFLRTNPGAFPTNGTLFLKNIQPLFSIEGKTSVSELVGIQKLQSDRDNTYHGGMEVK